MSIPKQKFGSLVSQMNSNIFSTRHMMIVSIVAMGVTSTVAIVGLATTVPRKITCECKSSCCT